MDRVAIPSIALLALSLTHCQQASSSALVGDWRAVEADGLALPDDPEFGGDGLQYGYDLHIEDDLSGELVAYIAHVDDPSDRNETVHPLTVDDDPPNASLHISAYGDPTRKVVLSCTHAGDTLSCDSTNDELPQQWIFERE